MEINYNYFYRNLKSKSSSQLHQEHAATMRAQLEETLGTFSGYFFVTLFLNEELCAQTDIWLRNT